jgi:pyrimidine deaminase RibD-like protein
MAGMTDYTGVPMDVILSHLRAWRDNTTRTIEELTRLKGLVEEQQDKLDEPNEMLAYIHFFIDLFSRYADDFERLLAELPRGVSEAHVQIVRQIYDSASHEEKHCVRFTDEHIHRPLKDESLRGLVDKIYGESRDMLIDYKDLSNLVPRLRTFIVATAERSSASDPDRSFAVMAIEEALKSVPEDGRLHPKVGAVVVKNGEVLSKAHRGENLKSHAEYIALEDKLSDDLVAGATVYTTLEPCTTRKHPKIPCAQRLVDRKVARVVIGMLDPNPDIRGLGDQLLSDAGIEVQLFPRDLRAKVEEMNREFIRAPKQKQPSTKTDGGMDDAAMLAARSLTDATWDLQQSAWSFYSLHTQYGVARAARDIANEEKEILGKMGAALRVFTRDYDLPADLAAVAKHELGNINIALVNLKAFLMNGQGPEAEIASTQVQDACQRIRIAAKPYAYRLKA